ncbi:epimerase [Streptomyces bottropensis ATCC 25435]|uniref:Epimerase n=1 Tax=Streptomyces bottropensis ATCC 25435 TaxID=1054862 RepID=M3DAM2_9ACTN|nr:epimerase [Streptomyces bottropensis ATCC 25435]
MTDCGGPIVLISTRAASFLGRRIAWVSPGPVREDAPVDPRNMYVFEDGRQRRDFVHVRNAAAADAAALEADAPVGALAAYGTGSGEPRTVGEMARAPAAAYGGPEPVVTGPYRLGDVRHITADSSRLRAGLGWKPEAGFAEGMREFARARLRGE